MTTPRTDPDRFSENPFGETRDSQGRIVEQEGQLKLTPEQRVIAAEREFAWKHYHATGEDTLLRLVGILPTDEEEDAS